MAIQFPTNPTIGQLYVNGSTSYTWNGYAWTGSRASSTGGVDLSNYSTRIETAQVSTTNAIALG